MNSASTPSLQEFISATTEAFHFLNEFRFHRISPMRTSSNPFELWFQCDERFIIIAGEGYGAIATSHLEHSSGVELPTIYLVPASERPSRKSKTAQQLDQIQQIKREADFIQRYASDFLMGDCERFFRLSKPLPPYKIQS